MENTTIPLAITKRLVNQDVQTTISLSTPDLFHFENDPIKLENHTPYCFQYETKNVERLVSAVQGDDETIRSRTRVLNPKTRRFRLLIQSLKNQIEQHSIGISRRETQLLSEKLTRELARAIDPASRHGKLLTLYSHQKYEHPIKLGRAVLMPDNFQYQPVEYDAIYSFNESLYLINDKSTLRFDKIMAQHLIAGKDIEITFRREKVGTVTLYDGEVQSEEQPNLSVIEPISEDDRALFLVHGLGSTTNQMNLKLLVNPYDFSFVDIALSIPRLSQEEAKNLMLFLYKSNYLSAFVRSKLCQFLYEMKLNQNRTWPELLGRFISFLNHDWFIESSKQIDRLELPQVVKSLAKLTPPTLFILDIIFTEYEGLERGDTVEFVWEFLCKSVFANLYLSNDEESTKKRLRLEALCQGTKEKPATSKTRIITRNVIEAIHNKADSYEAPIKRFSPPDFLHNLITSHPDDIMLILKNIPRVTEEASPLFYPIALEVKDALLNFDEFAQIENVSDEPGIVSNVEYRQSDTESISNAESKSTSSSNKKIKERSTSPLVRNTTKAKRKGKKASQGTPKKSVTQPAPELLLSENSDLESGSDVLSASSGSKKQNKPKNQQKISPKKVIKRNTKQTNPPVASKNSKKSASKGGVSSPKKTQEEILNESYSYEEEEILEYEYEYVEDDDPPHRKNSKKGGRK